MPDDQRSLPAFADLVEGTRTAPAPGPLSALRSRGRERYLAAGLPTRRNEAWKFTDLRRLAETAWRPSAAVPVLSRDDLPLAGSVTTEGPRVVLVNGRYDPALSSPGPLPAGIEITSLAEAAAAEPDRVERHLGRLVELATAPLAALNTAMLEDGLLIRVAAGARNEAPLSIVFAGRSEGDPVAHHPRVLVLIEDGATATLVESHVGEGRYFSNIVAEVAIGERASLRHYKVQNEDATAAHVAFTAVHLAEGATYESFVLQIGAALARHEVRATLDGRHIECRVDGAYLGAGRQHLDNTTFIDHAMPDCRSRQVWKGVLDGAAHGVFQGRILVRPHAQKTDGHQLSRALLLSRRAQASGKPELEIYADDVKCSHGATVGELDEEPLFYLRCRGIDEEAARKMLVEAFVGEVIDGIGDAAVREAVSDLARGWLESHDG